MLAIHNNHQLGEKFVRKHILELLIFLLIILIPLFSFSQSHIAVLELDEKGISQTEASILTDRLRIELFQTNKFIVVEREKMNDIFNEQGFQLMGCTSDECMVEAGKLIGVEQMIGGSVSKFGSTYSISIRLISVESGKILNTAIFDHNGMIDDLLKIGIKNVVQQLCGESQNTKTEKTNNANKTLNIIYSDNSNHHKNLYICPMIGLASTYLENTGFSYGMSIIYYPKYNHQLGVDISFVYSEKDRAKLNNESVYRNTIISISPYWGYSIGSVILQTGFSVLRISKDSYLIDYKREESLGLYFGIGYNFTLNRRIEVTPIIKSAIGSGKYAKYVTTNINFGIRLK